MRVLVENPGRLGYLLKDRVIDLDDFAATLRHAASGWTISTGVVQKHVGSLFAKLGISDSDDDHRRILAVLTFLRSLGATRLA